MTYRDSPRRVRPAKRVRVISSARGGTSLKRSANRRDGTGPYYYETAVDAIAMFVILDVGADIRGRHAAGSER